MDEWIAQMIADLPNDIICDFGEPSDAVVQEVVFMGGLPQNELAVSLIYRSECALQISVYSRHRSLGGSIKEYLYDEIGGLEESEQVKPLIKVVIEELSYRGALLIRKRFKNYLLLGSEAERLESMRRLGRNPELLRSFAPWSAQRRDLPPIPSKCRMLPWQA